jgi:hypothetical protein
MAGATDRHGRSTDCLQQIAISTSTVGKAAGETAARLVAGNERRC